MSTSGSPVCLPTPLRAGQSELEVLAIVLLETPVYCLFGTMSTLARSGAMEGGRDWGTCRSPGKQIRYAFVEYVIFSISPHFGLTVWCSFSLHCK
ncbi:unnamed protein product [Protopolystoma xenopodis]|uniref:Uncharacterized protein n=1 Tax=Protopolystoma xenopodis TaxID=117903 RepID=A0A448WPK6_9PLAT|nr:unnamed protein product [Protopolystoma xenopodis]